MIIEWLEVGPYASNCYIVGAETQKVGLIIDPGAEAKEILRSVKDLELEIKFIVLTHAHSDHIGALREVKEATNAEVAIHTEDARLLQVRNPLSALQPLSSSAPSPADRLLSGSESIDVAELHFLVLHTPGHTPGGICLLGEGVVFTGDTLFNLGIGRTDFPGGDYQQLMKNIQTKLMALPDNTIVYPGHGPKTTIGAERQWNSFLRG